MQGGGREESEDSGALLMKHMNTAGEDAAAFEVDSTAVVVRSSARCTLSQSLCACCGKKSSLRGGGDDDGVNIGFLVLFGL
jgi:hypothetical protein